jgi:hypothetical protein
VLKHGTLRGSSVKIGFSGEYGFNRSNSALGLAEIIVEGGA